MKVAYRLEALQDLDRHRAYILVRNPNAAWRITDTLRHSISRLGLLPYSDRQGIVPGTYTATTSGPLAEAIALVLR